MLCYDRENEMEADAISETVHYDRNGGYRT